MKKIFGLTSIAALLLSQGAMAQCSDVSISDLQTAANNTANTGGYGLPMWVTFVDETGTVCAVINTVPIASTEPVGNSAWLGSRVISAQKANTANDFSLDGYAISTANLYSAVQPGGSLYGLQHSNPVDPAIAYGGTPASYGKGTADPLVSNRIGGVNVFGGGLALYASNGTKKIGAIGVSGDTSCRDHANAWQIRAALKLQPAGVGITTHNMDAFGNTQHPLHGAMVGDEMIINASGDQDNYWTAWSQPACPNSLGLSPANNAANGTLIINHH